MITVAKSAGVCDTMKLWELREFDIGMNKLVSFPGVRLHIFCFIQMLCRKYNLVYNGSYVLYLILRYSCLHYRKHVCLSVCYLSVVVVSFVMFLCFTCTIVSSLYSFWRNKR